MAKVFIEVEWFVNEDRENEREWANYVVLDKYPDAYTDEVDLLVEEYLQSRLGPLPENSFYRTVLDADISFHKDYWGEVDVDFDWKQIYHTEIEVQRSRH